MRYLSEKQIIKLAEAQKKLSDELKDLLRKYHPRYRLRIITETELLVLLKLQK